jgi:hypothetical protein
VSAALLDLGGRRPSRAAESYLAETLGTQPGELRSRTLRQAIATGGPFDLVLCFERRHLVELADRHRDLRGRIHLVSALAPTAGGPADIADPHGRSDAAYRGCFERIQTVLAAATGGVPPAPSRAALHAAR